MAIVVDSKAGISIEVLPTDEEEKKVSWVPLAIAAGVAALLVALGLRKKEQRRK